jgi:hypothetical protein
VTKCGKTALFFSIDLGIYERNFVSKLIKKGASKMGKFEFGTNMDHKI